MTPTKIHRHCLPSLLHLLRDDAAPSHELRGQRRCAAIQLRPLRQCSEGVAAAQQPRASDDYPCAAAASLAGAHRPPKERRSTPTGATRGCSGLMDGRVLARGRRSAGASPPSPGAGQRGGAAAGADTSATPARRCSPRARAPVATGPSRAEPRTVAQAEQTRPDRKQDRHRKKRGERGPINRAVAATCCCGDARCLVLRQRRGANERTVLLPRGSRDAGRRLAWLKTPALKLAEDEVRSQSSAQAVHAPRLLRNAAVWLRCHALSAGSLTRDAPGAD